MKKYNEAVPEHAMVLRNGHWRKLETNSVVPGDIIKIERGERVPADVRVFECMDQCTFDTRMVCERDAIKQINISNSFGPYESAPNMAFLGYLCVEGQYLFVRLQCLLVSHSSLS
jgi:Ca2+-transporting ATPase